MSTMPSDTPFGDGPQRTSARTVAAIGVSGIASAVVFLVSLLWSSDDSPGGLIFAAGVGVVRAGFEVATWWARTYTVDPTELVVDEGLLTRHHRVVPYTRVQQVDLHRSFISQVFGVAELRIDTAGEAGATTVRLRLLEMEQAEQLRSLILGRRTAPTAGSSVRVGGHGHPTRSGNAGPAGDRHEGRPTTAAGPDVSADPALGPDAERPWADPPPAEPIWGLLRCDPRTLVIGALTHSSVVAGVPLAALVGLCTGALAMVALGPVGMAVGAGVALLLSVAALVGSAVANVWQLWDYSLSHQGDDLHLRFGVLDVRQLTIPRARVQQITITDNPVRRRLGLVGVTLHSATLPGGSGEQQRDTRFQIPVLDGSGLDDFLARMMGDRSWSPPPLIQRPDSARRRARFRRCALLAVLLIGPAGVAWPLGLVLLALVAAGVPWARLAHRSAGHGTSPSLVALARGAIHHRLDLVPLARIQSCRTSAGPLDRRRRLTVLHLDIAGSARAPSLRDIDAGTGAGLLRSLPRRGVAVAPTTVEANIL
jgi:putative membrane protein